jgi:hypothetical protein
MEENSTAYIKSQQGAVHLSRLIATVITNKMLSVITNEMLSCYPSKAQKLQIQKKKDDVAQ